MQNMIKAMTMTTMKMTKMIYESQLVRLIKLIQKIDSIKRKKACEFGRLVISSNNIMLNVTLQKREKYKLLSTFLNDIYIISFFLLEKIGRFSHRKIRLKASSQNL